MYSTYTFPGNLQLHKARVEEGGGQQEDTLNFRANLNNSSKASTAQPVDRYINRRFYLGYSTPPQPASHQPLPSLKREWGRDGDHSLTLFSFAFLGQTHRKLCFPTYLYFLYSSSSSLPTSSSSPNNVCDYSDYTQRPTDRPTTTPPMISEEWTVLYTEKDRDR